MPEVARERGRRLAREYSERGLPLGWFEPLYAGALGDPSQVQWADMAPNPSLLDWLGAGGAVEGNGRTLVVGCGLGDDAEELARRGCSVVAVDLSHTAIEWCRRRFPHSPVCYLVQDLFALPSDWMGAFDFVLEVYTMQVLPPDLRRDAMQEMSDLLAPGGVLLVVTRGRDETGDPGSMPWPLTTSELDRFGELGLQPMEFVDFLDGEEPPVRRFRALYRKQP